VSGSNEERPTAADETVEPEATPEVAAEEAMVEMSAAQALAHATEAATEATAESPATTATSAEPAESSAAPDTPAKPEADMNVTEETVSASNAQAADGLPAAADTEVETPADTEPVETTEAQTGATAESEVVAAVAEAAEVETETKAEAQPAEVETDTKAEAQPAEVETETKAEAQPAELETDTKAEAQPAEVETEAKAEAQDVAAETDSETQGAEARPETEGVDEKPTPVKPQVPPPPDRPELRAVREAMENRQPLEGRVIGWNHGGFHLALGELAAFCPRSEMEIGEVQEPESYLDQTFEFRVLRLQGKARRIVVSRAAHLRNEKTRQRNTLRKKLQVGTELDGTVASLKEFGAFVDLGGAQGLVHVSEISHRRVEHPNQVLSEGQEVRVKVLKIEQGGRRISLSIRALEPDPWKDLAARFPQGAVVKGTVERANQIGAFVELAPGVTGLLPARSMSIPRETTPARAYPPGKEISVQIVSVDPRRQRISLALEGSGLEGSRTDYKDYQRQSREESKGEGFNAMASAFRRLQGGTD
jgi:small subunit ribosomal protein S1